MFLPVLKSFESFLSEPMCSVHETRLLAAVATINSNNSTSHYGSFVDFFFTTLFLLY